MLSPNDVKEELSLAYVRAIASRAGFSIEEIRKDRDSVDLKVCARGLLAEDAVLTSPELAVQLKATVLEPLPSDEFSFVLSRKNYDDLSAPRSSLGSSWCSPCRKTSGSGSPSPRSLSSCGGALIGSRFEVHPPHQTKRVRRSGCRADGPSTWTPCATCCARWLVKRSSCHEHGAVPHARKPG